MIEILNICLHKNSIFIKFFKILKIHEIFCENPRIIFVLFYDVHKENMFTIYLEDGREAPSKVSFNKKMEIFFSFGIIFDLKCGLGVHGNCWFMQQKQGRKSNEFISFQLLWTRQQIFAHSPFNNLIISPVSQD